MAGDDSCRAAAAAEAARLAAIRRAEEQDRDDREREKGLKKSKMLIGGQAKFDKNKNNRLDSEDFKLLRAGKKRERRIK